MSWSDDRFKSTFHRVKAPSEPDDYWGERYSIACKLFSGPEYQDERPIIVFSTELKRCIR